MLSSLLSLLPGLCRVWKLLDRENYNSVGFTATGEGWVVGPKGRIAKAGHRDGFYQD